MRGLKEKIFLMYVAICRFFVFLKTFNSKNIRKKIREIEAGKGINKNSNELLIKRMHIMLSCLINSRERKEMLDLSISHSLSKIENSGMKVKVVDASDKEYVEKNRRSFEKIKGINIEFENKKQKFAQAYYNMLIEAREDYFFSIFDDQPAFGVSPNFLSSCIMFLDDFKGMVDVILVELMSEYKIDDIKKEIRCDLNSIEFKTKGMRPVGVVKYGEYSFAIFNNFHYGFFFNVMIGRCSDYAKRLKWYMNNVGDNTVKIEKRGAWRTGPIYEYIAIPLDVFMMNIDCVHTVSSERSVTKDVQDLYGALKNGYKVLIK